MSYFFNNDCKYKNCGRRFNSLDELIIHVEDVHIDFNLEEHEEKEIEMVQCCPLSYILPYNREENRAQGSEQPGTIKKETLLSFDEIKKEPLEYSSSESVQEIYIPIETEPDQKNKCKRFCCPIDGCLKRYKNHNGMKYHIMNYHDISGNPVKPKKEFKCSCGREYKTLRGLQSHAISHKDPSISQTKSKGEHNKTKPTGYPTIMPRSALNNRLITNILKRDAYKRLISNNNEKERLNFTTLDHNSFAGINPIKSESRLLYSPLQAPADKMYGTGFYSEYGYENELNAFAGIFRKLQ